MLLPPTTSYELRAYLKQYTLMINAFRFADDKLLHLSHILIGVVVVLACNAMVIVAIIAAIHSLMIPWLVVYGVGKYIVNKTSLYTKVFILDVDVRTIMFSS